LKSIAKIAGLRFWQKSDAISKPGATNILRESSTCHDSISLVWLSNNFLNRNANTCPFARCFQKAIGATPSGIQYLVSKALLQSSTALNVAMYLLLKSEQAMNEDTDLMDGDAVSAIESHPVIARLQQLNKLSQKLEERVESKVDTLNEQIDTLVKANDLINTGEDDSESSKRNDDDSAAIDDDDKEEHVEGEPVGENAEAQVSKYSASSSSEDESEDDIATSVMNDAKFGLRPQELGAPRQKATKRSCRAVPLDYGDEDDTGLNTKATQSLASTINAIEQRSATRSRKRRSAATTETLDEQDEDSALRRGLEMMEAELGRLDSDEEEHDKTELDEELNDDPDEDDFYKSVKERSKAKKQRKAAMYTVAPKYPGMDHEIQGELCYFIRLVFR
jgi:U3 small nucleolar RNA-associated protein 3